MAYRCLSILKLVFSSVSAGSAIKSLLMLVFQINERKKIFLLDFNSTQKQQTDYKRKKPNEEYSSLVLTKEESRI